MPQFVQRLFIKLHVALYRLSRGRLGGRMSGADVLLLNTVGRKSGRGRTVPLLYIRDGEAYVVVASAAGAPSHPAWYRNLEAQPEVTIQIKGETVHVTAETAGSWLFWLLIGWLAATTRTPTDRSTAHASTTREVRSHGA